MKYSIHVYKMNNIPFIFMYEKEKILANNSCNRCWIKKNMYIYYSIIYSKQKTCIISTT